MPDDPWAVLSSVTSRVVTGGAGGGDDFFSFLVKLPYPGILYA